MPNVRVIHLQADDWTDILVPIACQRFVLENADPQKAFSFRTDGFGAQRDIAPGFGVEVFSSGRSFSTTKAAGQVRGGDIVISIGMSLQNRRDGGALSS